MSTGALDRGVIVRAIILTVQVIAAVIVVGWGAAAVWPSSRAPVGYAVATAPLEPTVVELPSPVPTPLAGLTSKTAVASSAASRVDAAWLDQVAGANDIPRRVLAAYATASIVIAEEQPSCHLGWTTIAAIGKIESNDDRFGGATVLESGYGDRGITGPQLSGGEFASIPDSDKGVWDGDPAWDRAVGPFQFIPQTWSTWGADGNADGRADPGHIDDAALAAARYLCHSGDLSDAARWRAAVFSYNHSVEYVSQVASIANGLVG